MVLAELGGKLRESLRKLQTSSQNQITQKELNTLLSEISRALIEADVQVKLVMSLRDNVKQQILPLLEEPEDETKPKNVAKLVQKCVMEELVKLLTPSTNTPYKMRRGKPNVILFLGLQGAGKTTTVAKVANYYSKRGWKTAMVCADTFRAGAFDQLKQNATKLRVPFYGSYTEADPVVIAAEGVESFSKKYEVILVDTSGRHKQEASLLEEMQEISSAIRPDQTVFVMDATQGQAIYDQALGFHNAVQVGSVIVTKLDGHAKGGGALSAVAATNSPILFTGSGEHFDDLEGFNAQSFVSKLLGLGDMRGLMEELQSVQGSKTQKELMKNMEKGQFTLRDMYSQMENMTKMGTMNKMMNMMPGIPEYMIPQSGQDDESTKRLKVFMYMMDSMTAAELDGKVDLHKHATDAKMESRIRRIARGSGRHPTEVLMLLQAHKQFEGMVQKMGKSGLLGKGAQDKQKQMMQQMRKNPNQMMQRLNQMDPAMLQQMGGRENVMQMMQQMSRGGGGGGGMEDMMAAMQQSGGGMPPGMGSMMGGSGGMDMNAISQMMQQMGGMGGMGGSMGGGGSRR